MAKKFDSKLLTTLASALIQGQDDPRIMAAHKAGIEPIIGGEGDNQYFSGYNWGDINPTKAQMLNVEQNADRLADLQNIDEGVSLPQLGGLAIESAKLHPFKTAGLVGLGAGNLGGLTDNDKFGGQLGGLALGGLGSYLMGASPYTAAMLTMGGGELGSLFDKLRARKEQEQTQSYYGGR